MPKNGGDNRENFRFAGFDPPYYTPVPDAVFDELLPQLAGNEVKVLLYIIRRTFGFKKQADAISLAQITDGIVRHDGTRLDGGAGVSKAGAILAIRGLVEKEIILAERQQAPNGGHAPTVYRLHMRTVPLSKNSTRGLDPCLKIRQGLV